MKYGRPATGRKGKPVNIYLPADLVEAAKQRFAQHQGISLSEGVRKLLHRELGKTRRRAA